MITRFALFNGKVKPGQDAAMRVYVNASLRPLWEQFTGAAEVKVMFGATQDPNGPEIPLILAITYPDREAIDRAMASPARLTSRDMLPAFYAEFFDEVQLWHYEMEHATADSGSQDAKN